MKQIGDWIAGPRPAMDYRAQTLAMAAPDDPGQGGGGPWGPKEGDAPARGDAPADDTPGDPGDPGKVDAPAGAPPPGGPPRNPWLPPAEPPRRSAGIEDIFRPRGKTGSGPGRGSGASPPGGFAAWASQVIHLPPRRDGRSWLPLILGGLALLWLLVTSSHQLGSTQAGVVTTFGRYSHQIGPGVSLTAPWPIQDVSVTDVTSIRRDSIPEGDGEKLMLTSDQNLVDLSYIVRWNIRDLKLYSYQLDDPEATVKEVAEAAMRASVAEVRLADVMGGNGRAQIEQDVRQRMQAILDAYLSGVVIQGVDIKKSDPPAKVNDAFQKVTVAQQEANRDLYNAQGLRPAAGGPCPGRDGDLRQGLWPIQARAGSDAAADVLRNDGAGPGQ